MKKLSSLKGVKTLSKKEQTNINGNGAPKGVCPSGQVWCPTQYHTWYCTYNCM